MTALFVSWFAIAVIGAALSLFFSLHR